MLSHALPGKGLRDTESGLSVFTYILKEKSHHSDNPRECVVRSFRSMLFFRARRQSFDNVCNE